VKIHRAMTRPGVLAVGLLLTCPLVGFGALAQGPDGNHDGRCPGPDFHSFRGPPGPGFGPGRAWGAPPPFLAGLHLTDEQQDKVFSILYAAAPAMRDQEKALRKAHEALGKLNDSGEYDENRVKGLAESAAKAESQLTVLRVRADHEIYSLLTPEQRKQISDRHERRGPRDHGGPPPGGPSAG
jgi:periplasmic protein CpxP/Spy